MLIKRKRKYLYKKKICQRCGKEFIPESGHQRLCGSVKQKTGCSWVWWSKEKGRQYYHQHREQCKKNHLNFLKRNPDYIEKWENKNIDRRRVYRKRSHKLYKLRHRDKVNFKQKCYRQKKSGAEGTHTLKEWENLKAQYKWTCPACGRKEPEIKLTEDHIIPISKGGSNYIENIQPLCRNCNCKKNNKIIYYLKVE